MKLRSRYRAITDARVLEFTEKGYKQRYVFPHSIYYLPKCGPDAFKLTTRMCGISDLNRIWEVVLYAHRQMLEEFPVELFFDDDVIWHQQQFGKSGQVATANLAVDGSSLYSMVHISDVVQRISRRRDYKTRIENRFKGWNHMLFNAVLNFAQEQRIQTVCFPTADFALRHTDPKRNPGRELFERIYDRNVNSLFHTRKDGNWWKLNLDENRNKIVLPEIRSEENSISKIVCICHDVEKGFGHTDVDPEFAEFAHTTAADNLTAILAVERDSGVKATYNVLGRMFQEVEQQIRTDGHCIAFHSYDHGFDESEPHQLIECRKIDYRIKGYRPPQSKITKGLSESHLAFHNFEWLASSTFSLGFSQPQASNRIVKIPIFFDDFHLYRGTQTYQDWEDFALKTIRENDFVAFSLHDCYAKFWLSNYQTFLEKIVNMAELKTMNQIASDVFLGNSV